MITCLGVEQAQYFLELMSHITTVIDGGRFVVFATEGPVIWTYNPEINMFCKNP